MNELALFAGIGGGLLGSKLLGWKTIAAVEISEYCRSVLICRQDEGYLEPFPIWDDARTFKGTPFCGSVDIITAGFPCQPFSENGTQFADKDPRNLWPDTIRIIREVRPTFVFLENVPGLLFSGYFSQVAADLVSSGFCFQWRVLSAAQVGAPHRRDRFWLIAHPDGFDLEARRRDLTIKEKVARADCESWWQSASGIPRVDDGVANRVERTRAIGNGQVPGVVRLAWEYYLG